LLVVLVVAGCGSTERRAAPETTRATTTTTTTTIRRAPPRTTTTVRPLAPIVGGVTAVGDSLMIDAGPALRALVPGVDIDAAVSRSALPGPSILRRRAAVGRLGNSIVFDLALNGGVTPNLIGTVFDIAAGRRVVMLTARCPYCTYTAGENDVIRRECVRARNCHVADWEALANAHPEWFGSDGVHMGVGGRGAQAYAQLVRSELSDPVR
jgi:hypothetical protein